LSIILAFSAFYELVEWWVALAVGENAEAFLGTQGYILDMCYLEGLWHF
jgi:putative membrane protein